MKRIRHIAAKELLQTRRDWLAALFTLVLPVVFTVFMGILIEGFGDGPDKLPLAVADQDATGASRELVEFLREDPLLEIELVDPRDIDKAVLDQEFPAGLLIPDGYAEALEKGPPSASVTFIRAQATTGAQSVMEAVQAALGRLNSQAVAAGTAARQVSVATGVPLDNALRAQSESLVEAQLAAPSVSVRAEVSGAGRVRPLGGFDQASTGSLVNWVLFSLLTVTTGLVLERRRGLTRRLSVAGVGSFELFGGKLIAMLVITFLQQLFLILLGQLAFGVDYFNSPAALLLVMVSLSVFAASVGLLISSVFRSEQAVIATTVIAAQLLAALGGAWFPLEVASPAFSEVARFLPTSWVMDSLHGIILKDWGIVEVAGALGVTWLWTAALFGLAVWRFRPQ